MSFSSGYRSATVAEQDTTFSSGKISADVKIITDTFSSGREDDIGEFILFIPQIVIIS